MATPIPKNRAHFELDELILATGGQAFHRAEPNEVVSVTTDSRAVEPGGLFVALRGASVDGHAFVAGAMDRGAAAVVVLRGFGRVYAPRESCSIIEVTDTLEAWGDLARLHLEAWRAADPARRVVAITGSAGKTTTKELTAALLGAVAPTHFTAGNLNNRIGLPAVIFALEERHRFAVLEMGMSVPGEIDAMASIARPDVAVVTNVLVAHAEGVGGIEGVMHEKGGVYRALREQDVAVVNADDSLATLSADGTAARDVRTFGRAAAATYRLVRRTPLTTLPSGVAAVGSKVVIARGAEERALHLPLPGEAAAIDLAAALAAAEAASGATWSLGESALDDALGGLRLDGRANVRILAQDTLVLDDTYNANPGSMRAALATLAEIAGNRRKVVVIGEMKELGAHAEDEHVALGEALAETKVALAIGCGGLASLALGSAARRGVKVLPCGNTEEAAVMARERVLPGDAVLVKGSRSVGAEKVVAALLEVLPPSTKSASSAPGGSASGPPSDPGSSE